MENLNITIASPVPNYMLIEEFIHKTKDKLSKSNEISKEEKEEMNILLEEYTKYLTKEELEKIYSLYNENNHGISNKRTRQVKRILDKLEIEKDMEWKKLFLQYEEYINYDKIIVIEHDKRLLGSWKIRTVARCNIEIKE